MVKIVNDVFSKGFIEVQENDTVSSVQSLFKEGLPPVLAVFDDKGNYKGVLSQKSIKRSSFDASGTKVKTLTQSAPAVTLQDTLSKVAKLMIESEIRQLPVYSENKLVGFVTDEEVIHGAVLEKWKNANFPFFTNLWLSRELESEPFSLIELQCFSLMGDVA